MLSDFDGVQCGLYVLNHQAEPVAGEWFVTDGADASSEPTLIPALAEKVFEENVGLHVQSSSPFNAIEQRMALNVSWKPRLAFERAHLATHG
ncbi:hypothetical protein StoSoilB13_18870 [Arthrobacter sp. StoSoilB13]|nr:hypothetical protein StoSoilB13_18870 [Arthrobacter sp. StoSoilB13]